MQGAASAASASDRLDGMPPVGPPVLPRAAGASHGRRGGRGARVARGVCAAALSTGVALASHVLAGAPAPGVLGVGVPLLLATAACVALAGVRLSVVRLGLSVLVSQLLFHSLFVVGTVPAGATVAPAGATSAPVTGVAGHLGHETALVVSGSTVHPHHDGGWMWLAHAVAAAGTVLALRHGERAIAHLLRVASTAVVVLAPRVVVVQVVLGRRRPAPVDGGHRAVRPTLAALTGPVARRGPPVVLAV